MSETSIPPSPSSAQSRADLEAEAAVLLELDSRARRAPLFYFEPHKAQDAFLSSRAKIVTFLGGNRSGKTEALTVKGCQAALGYAPWKLRELGYPLPPDLSVRPPDCPPEALAYSTAGVRLQIPSTVLVISALPAVTGLGQILVPKFLKYLSGIVKTTRRGHGGVICEIELTNGSKVLFVTAHSDSMSFEGSAFDAVLMDEPPPRSIWTGVRRATVDKCAPTYMSFTPLGPNAAWIHHEIVSTADDKNVAVFSCSIFANPFLSDDQRSAIVDDPVMTEAEREARLHGRFISLSDRIYPSFDPRFHVVDDFSPPSTWPVFTVVDPHQIKPWAICLVAVSPQRDFYFFREWPNEPFHKLRRDPRNLESYALLLRQLEGTSPVLGRVIDPNAGPRTDTMRGIYIPSFTDELAKYGLDFFHRFPDALEIGEALVRRRLAVDPSKPLGPYNRPSLFVSRSCSNIINSLQYYAAKNKPGTFNEPVESKRDETYKDFADLVRYACVSGIVDYSDLTFSDHPRPPTNLSYLSD